MSGYWLFFLACGHPFGLSNVRPGVATEEEVWNHFYDTWGKQIDAEDRGVTVRLVDRDTYRRDYYELMRAGCTCAAGTPR